MAAVRPPRKLLVKVKLTLRRGRGDCVDLMATLDVGATVGQLAQALQTRDPRQDSGLRRPMTLELLATRRQRLDPAALVVDSNLASGSTVALAPIGRAGGSEPAAAAIVRVLEGPDASREYRLQRGINYVGRSTSCEVRLTDTSVSRRHAKLTISDVAEVVDLGSSNGIAVDGGQITRAVLRARDLVRLGDTVLGVEICDASAAATGGAQTMFNRSPRLDPSYPGVELVLPDPPERPQNPRFPMLSLLAPLIFGALLFLVTRSPTSLLFVALSPIMAVTNVVESRFAGRRAHEAAMQSWQAELDGLAQTAVANAGLERESRLREHPAAEEVRQAIARRSSLLWSRHPDQDRFLELRLGLGTQPSRSAVQLPRTRKAAKEVWQQLEDFAVTFGVIAAVPVVGDLRDEPLGVAAPRRTAVGLARALVQQIVGLHSPAEVILAAVLASDTTEEWNWLQWLPHTSSAHSPITSPHVVANPAAVAALMAELEQLTEDRSSTAGPAEQRPAIVLLVEDAAACDRARLVSLAERGARTGVHVLWVSPSVERLPAVCTTFLEVTAGQQRGLAGFTQLGTAVTPLTVELADGASALATARSLAPLVDSGAPLDDESDLPSSVSWLSLHERDLAAEPGIVLERWQESRSLMTGPLASPPRHGKPGSLRAVLGQFAGGPHILDLRAHGPHALVGGTTGSGKSELLQSWILSLAAAHSPQRVTFLLVDYKGGSAFRDCRHLPHTVGQVTDLSPHLVRRALTSLSAELRYREELLASKNKKDLADLEESGDPATPPSLVIVVDEFAALVHEVPEFVDGVVNVAQRGRSLGLHLLLATQRPAGVIKGNLRANTNLRLALRVADDGDSTDVIGTTQAAAFDPALPGRALSKTGPGRLVPFQSAYAGGWTTAEPAAPSIGIEELTTGVSQKWEEPVEAEPATVGDLGPTDITRVVTTIGAAARQAELPEPRKPWLPELADVGELADLPTGRDGELVFGQADRPHSQSQPTIAFHPDRAGNLAVYGTGGSGKSGLLRTLAIAAGRGDAGGPCRVYGLDFGARGLDMLEELPHVGSIIRGEDHERLSRLLGDLRELLDERAGRYAKAKAGSIAEYRQLTDSPQEPRILLLVDGIGAFRLAYEATNRVRWFELFQSIAVDGRPVGVHIVVSADRAAAVPSSLGSAIQARVVLRLADEGDYGTLGEPADVLDATSPPGRGLVAGDEVQVAILGGTRSTLAQAQAIADLAARLRRQGVPEAPAVQRLSEEVWLDELPARAAGLPVIGVAGTHLGPQGFPPSGSFIVTGPPGSGRSTALATVLTSIRRSIDGVQVHYIGNRRSPLATLSFLASSSLSAGEAAAVAGRLTAELTAAEHSEPVMVIVEGVGDYLNGPADMSLQQLTRALLAEDQLIVFEGETSTMGQGSSLLSLAKAGRSGLALQPESAEASVFRSEFPRLRRAELPAGRGVLVISGRPLLVQVARPGQDDIQWNDMPAPHAASARQPDLVATADRA
jgi:DNA segregation ATPase FtsK/SpoIIIE, S-DNA-T family